MDEFEAVPGVPENTRKILRFLRQIGLGVRLAQLQGETFLPGLRMEPGGLAVDLDKLLYAGDLLHEAGHLAVMTPERRAEAGADVGSEMGDEIAAQCWSYAAAMHLELPAEVVFHEHGYHGAAQTLISGYKNGSVGVPLLQWMGLTLDARRAAEEGKPAWPHMIRWLRQDSEPG